jgi:uncharacterized protein YgbK (DUF1537 family)
VTRLLAYYGDDFTGSTDVMEVLTFAGVPTVLFLAAPSESDLLRFPEARAIGIAGTARSRSPDWMRANLPATFRALHALGTPILHYKVCSTFDSSPNIGSIGCALDLAFASTGRPWCVLVVGAPALRRYQAFGTLFAAVDGVAHRLDRHPTMSRHPVTPMGEADLRRHLAEQTSEPIALIDLVAQKSGIAEAILANRPERAALFDVIDDQTLAETGRLVWQRRGDGILAVASSGLEYALVMHWRATGLLPQLLPPPAAPPVERLFGVSGSCSPVTAEQIAWATAHGFATIRLDVLAAIDPSRCPAEIARATAAALRALETGRDALVLSADGPHDPAIARLRAAAVLAGEPDEEAQRRVASALGQVLASVVVQANLPRVVVAGGDTSGEVTGRLGITALEAISPLAPGGPLCRGHRAHAPTIEIVLKGGQIGGAGFFGDVKRGRLAG